MSAPIVFGQMMIIFALMLIGMMLCKAGIIERKASKYFSAMVVNICAPALTIVSVLNQSDRSSSGSTLIKFGILSFITYIVLIVLGYIFLVLLRPERKRRADYQLMTIYGNCGFIGIPVASALIGPQSLIYVAIFNLCYNLFVYTYGTWLIISTEGNIDLATQLRKMLNPGTMSCIVALIIFSFEIKVPVLVYNFLNYAGQPATLLSLVVIGMSLADMKPVELVNDLSFFIFTILRFVVFPIIYILVTKSFITDIMMRSTMALMIAVPVGNIPAMMRAQYGQDDSFLAKGTVITTTLSVITIPIVCMFV